MTIEARTGEPRDSTGLRFVWVGGHSTLDFHNTAVWSKRESPLEETPLPGLDLLQGYVNLANWGAEAGMLENREADTLIGEASRFPEEAERITGMAIELRRLIHGIFASVTRGHPADGPTLAGLNLVLTDAMTRLRITRDGDRFGWSWIGTGGSLDRPLWPIVRATAELMTSPSLQRIKVCEGERCGFMFVDTSRRGRRWCDMALCDNRAKSRRHYSRARTAGQ